MLVRHGLAEFIRKEGSDISRGSHFGCFWH
jgi:hypothetical protein